MCSSDTTPAKNHIRVGLRVFEFQRGGDYEALNGCKSSTIERTVNIEEKFACEVRKDKINTHHPDGDPE